MNWNLNNLSHHAYLLIGNIEARLNLISMLEKEHKIIGNSNPDFFDRSYENLTIDDARELKSEHSTRPIGSSGKKIFIITTNGITIEAQNALLKLLEEPAPYTHFFLIIPMAHILLPTVKSRMQQVTDNYSNGMSSNNNEKQIEMIDMAHKFLQLSSPKRLEIIKKLMDDITKEKKTKQDAINFLNAIQAVIYKDKGVRHATEALEVIDIARNYIHDRAPSVKMLMEYVALRV